MISSANYSKSRVMSSGPFSHDAAQMTVSSMISYDLNKVHMIQFFLLAY